MIRIYQHGDHEAIASIFTRAIHEIATEYYTAEQCLAWSGRRADLDHWKKRCELKRPFVYIIDDQIAGFLELDPDGHIDCAFTNPDYKRRGIMTQLVQHAIQTAFDCDVPKVYVEASYAIKPLFDKLGFETLTDNMVTINGIELVNFKMELLK